MRIRSVGVVTALVTFCLTAPAVAGIHTWDVREVFSNADGSIQFVELFDAGAGGTEVGVGNGTLTSNAETYGWANGPVAQPTNGKSYLIATQSFADLSGAPAPDVILPLANIPFFNTAGDTVGFSSGDSWAFGAVPTNGTDSLDRIAGVGANSPTNYAGATGSVDANPPGPVSLPAASPLGVAMLVVLLGGGGLAIALRRRSA